MEFWGHILFHQCHETNFSDKLIHANVVNHYNSDRLRSLCATMQSKTSYLKILEIQD